MTGREHGHPEGCWCAACPVQAGREATPEAVAAALEELTALTTCGCADAWTDRSLHDPSCLWDYREDVDTLRAALSPPARKPSSETVGPPT